MSSSKPEIFPLKFLPPAAIESNSDCDSELGPEWETLLEARFDTGLLDKTLLSRFGTLQVKTTTTGEYRTEDERDVFTWFNIALHLPEDQSAPRPGPRANLPGGGLLRWLSHSNRPKAWDNGNQFDGRIFSQGDEIIKQLEFGNVIVVTLCARTVPATDTFGVSGELVITLLDQEPDRDQTSCSRYRATEPCRVQSDDHIIQSKIWFSTPALDKNTLSKLDTVQLFAESRDQGWVDDPRTGSYSWFDLVILSTPNDKQPRFVDGLELAWRSHTNNVGDPHFEVLEGFMFNSKHDLLRLLEDGNAIAVRVSSRFCAWENLANDGCLELRFSATEIKHKKAVAQDSLVEAAKIKHMLAEYFIAAMKNGTGPMVIELSPVVLDLLKMPTAWDQVGGQKKPELMLLSLDGGGVRGLSALHMLKAIMEQIRVDRRLEKTPKPCEVFDLIVGTSTGGLIALMLARLELSVEDCITHYERLAEHVFGKKTAERYEGLLGKLRKAGDNIQKGLGLATDAYMYDASKLEDAIKQVVKAADRNGNPDAEMWSDTKCRAVVVASRTDDVSTRPPTHFRTYWMKSMTEEDSPKCKIWEAARATSAAPAYFERIKVAGYEYVDGGLQANNPVIQTLSESMIVFDEPRPVGCLISLGTGMPPPQVLKDSKGFFGSITSMVSLGEAIMHQLTNAHRAHLDVLGLNLTHKLADRYYRFNAPLHRDISTKEPKWESKFVGLDDTSLMVQFKDAADSYMKTEDPHKWMKECALILGKRLDGQAA